jgi:hypothetical protein
VSNLKTRYRKMAEGGVVEAPAPIAIDDDPSVALRQQITALRESERIAQEKAAQPAPPVDPLREMVDRTGLPPMARDWLLKPEHRRFIENEDDNKAIRAEHEILLDEGVEAYGEAYWKQIEARLLKPKASQGEIYSGPNSKIVLDGPKKKDQLYTSRGGYQAPVSRTVPNTNGTRAALDDPRSVVLTPSQIEHAQISGLSREEYSRQVLELERRKRDGTIQ